MYTYSIITLGTIHVPELVKEYVEKNPEVGHPPEKKAVIVRKNPSVSKYYH